MQVSGVRLKQNENSTSVTSNGRLVGVNKGQRQQHELKQPEQRSLQLKPLIKKKKRRTGANLASEGVAPVSACRCLPASYCVITRSNRPLPAPYDLQSALCFN